MEPIVEAPKSSELASNLLNWSIGFVGISITVISLFQIQDKNTVRYVDEMFGVTVGAFMICGILSFACLWFPRRIGLLHRAKWAFVLGLLTLLNAAAFLVWEL
mgnify:CR=1 FL=1